MKKPYHHGNLKEELVSAGIAVLAKDGVNGLRLREVAAMAGVTHTAVYRHFAGKEDLLASIAEQGFLGLVKRVDTYQKRAGPNLRKQYLESGRAYVEFAIDNPEQFRIMFSGVIRDRKAHPALEKAADESFGQLVAVVEECRTKGIIPTHRDRHVHALAAWSMLHGIATLLIEGQFASGRARTRYLTHALLRLLIA